MLSWEAKNTTAEIRTYTTKFQSYFLEVLLFLIQQDKIKPSESSLQFSETENALQSHCNRNPLSKALLLMHMAGQAVTSRSHVGTERQAQLLQVYYVTQVSHINNFATHLYFCVRRLHFKN